MPTSNTDASHIETLRENGEAIADAVAAHMLIHATDHHHETIRKKGTFKVSEEEDCSHGIKEIVRKRYQNPLPYIEELGLCTRKLHVLDRSSAGSGQVLRLSLSLQWNLPVTHENDLSEYTRIYTPIIVFPEEQSHLKAVTTILQRNGPSASAVPRQPSRVARRG
jgi:hypothetical protein